MNLLDTPQRLTHALKGIGLKAIMGMFMVFGLWGLLGIQALPAFAAGSALTVTPAHGVAGTHVSISGTGFGATETVTAYWNCSASPCTGDTVLGTANTDATGAFTGMAATIPSVAPGKYLIAGIGGTSHDFAKKSFTVTASKASMTITPAHGAAGSMATLAGANFKASELVTFYWNCPTVSCTSTTTLGSVTTSATGTFSGVSVTIPSTATFGKYDIGGKGAGGDFAAKSFGITPTLSANPARIAPNGQTTLSGTGYGANETVTIYWNCSVSPCTGATVLGTVITSATGTFSLAVTIPANATINTTYAIAAKGGTSGAFGVTDVKVI